MTSIENQWAFQAVGPDNSAEACALLPALAANEVGAIQISQFLCRQELDVITANMGSQDIAWYENKERQQGRIGINATGYSHKAEGKQEYFDLTPQAEQARDEIFAGTQSPIDKITEFFSEGYTASVATEPDMNNARYFAGLIRAMGAKSTLHFDYAPKQLPGWSVAEADEQFGLVLYLQMPAEGGELNVYNRPWQPEDERHNNDIKEKGTYGFDEEVVGDAPHISVQPSEGDLVVFKPRNFHQVGEIKSDKPRLGLTTFMSLKGDRLSLWS